MLTTPPVLRAWALQNKYTHTCYSIIAPTLLATQSPAAKIELGSICDTASPASPVTSLVFRSIYPRAIYSLVFRPKYLHRWLKQELRYTLQSVVVMHLKVSCQLPYKVQRRSSSYCLKEERLLETNLVYPFICGLIVREEDLSISGKITMFITSQNR